MARKGGKYYIVYFQDNIDRIALTNDVLDKLWLPYLVSNSRQIVKPEDIIETSLTFNAVKAPESTLIQVMFQPEFQNLCRDMSFWNFPFESFGCDFYLFIRSLPSDTATLSGKKS